MDNIGELNLESRMDVAAILDGEAKFPAIGATEEDCREIFLEYGRRCVRADRILSNLTDLEDFDEERERQEAVQELLQPMKVIALLMATQPPNTVLKLFSEHFMTNESCLSFFEVLRQNNPLVNSFMYRLDKLVTAA